MEGDVLKSSICRGVTIIMALVCATAGLGVVNAPEASAFDKCTTIPSSYSTSVSYGHRDKGYDPYQDVEWYQCSLFHMGYKHVFDDGVGYFGSHTLAAVKTWQKRHPYLGATSGNITLSTANSINAGCKGCF